jgi:abortive infection bacteriophage resistance protein
MHMRVHGKGGKLRYLPLHPSTARRLDDYLQEVDHADQATAPLFQSLSNASQAGQGITADGLYKMLAGYLRALRLDGQGLSPHSLRATAATNALEHDADIAKVQEWLGHANISTTRISAREFGVNPNCGTAPKTSDFVPTTPLGSSRRVASDLEVPSGFSFLVMPFRPYTKAPLTSAAIVAKLQQQGLAVSNPATVGALLERISYFRVRGYLFPYFDLVGSSPVLKAFKAGANIEQALQMYGFDEGLRALIFDLMPQLEIALRTVLDSVMSHTAGHCFWYLQPQWFAKGKHPTHVISTLNGAFCKSAEKYADHYRDTYYNEQSGMFKNMPPFWVISELSTFGQIKDFFENLKEDASPFPATTLPKSTVLDKMAQRRFGAKHFRDLAKWVHMLRDVRNVCAHHGRLWNKNFLAPPSIQSFVSKPFPPVAGSTNSIYAALVVVRIMCKAIGISDSIKPELTRLFSQFPEAALHKVSMGMPLDWDADSVWL